MPQTISRFYTPEEHIQVRQAAEADWERYRDNKATIYHAKSCYQNDQQIKLVPQGRLIRDPVGYEMEYKKSVCWSRKDLELFLVKLLQHPKPFELVSDALPHKKFQDVTFLYAAMKKHFKLKRHLKVTAMNTELPHSDA